MVLNNIKGFDCDLFYDSFMIKTEDLFFGGFRLIETDKPLVVKLKTKYLIEGVTSDVIHSWACPLIGVKFDVVPGRLNFIKLVFSEVGVFFGQCSEICGANHRFMPIEVEVISFNELNNNTFIKELELINNLIKSPKEVVIPLELENMVIYFFSRTRTPLETIVEVSEEEENSN